ncbi:MAG: glutathione S-transferase family protein [Alphaproteobacteria bacterium]|nr:glutathione S-transferase family protein [Alphaproteobacteria bacterium]
MRKLEVFGPGFGVPDPSLFCMKALVLLKMAGLDYEPVICDPRKTPKGKAPVLHDDGEVIADSTFIRWHIEKKYGFDFDAGLTDEQRGVSWAVEKLCEDNIYWAGLYERWMVDENFKAGPVKFFESIPFPMRPIVAAMVRGQLKRNLWGHGLSRHSRQEIVRIGNQGVDAISQILGGKPYLMGDEPKGVDAIAFSTVAAVLCEHFESDMLGHATAKANLVAYRDRCMELWFPEMAG